MAIVPPYSATITSTISCSAAATASCSRCNQSIRSSRVVRATAGNAAFAAAIARCASTSSARITVVVSRSVAGSSRTSGSRPCGVTNAPLI
jgi:hypothetical protein